MNDTYHENPFEDPTIAQQWIRSRESTEDLIYLNEVVPLITNWAKSTPITAVADIGCGQGIISELFDNELPYIGVEPSTALIARAKEKYTTPTRQWIIGDARAIPLPDKHVDGSLSINVWFHLRELSIPSQEMARILRPGGHFLISTVNPAQYGAWRKLYSNVKEYGDRFEGTATTPHVPLTRKVVYTHTLDTILHHLRESELLVEKIQEYGYLQAHEPLFVMIYGQKK